MTSNKGAYTEAYVWTWLPHETSPVVAGRISMDGRSLVFNYGKSYLDRPNAISLYDVELPLKAGTLPLLPGLNIPGAIRDGAPDTWGRRVIMGKRIGTKALKNDSAQLDEFTYMLESGSDRIGALDFQLSPTHYEPRYAANVSLEELLASAERVEKGVPLTEELDLALHHGSAIGGARPKALIEDGPKKYIAKFSSTTDLYNVVKAEFVAMRLAKMAGLDVAAVSLTQSSKKDVLLIERFDRLSSPQGWQRKSLLSALTILGLDEMMARYASYQNLAEIIRHRFTDAAMTLRELFSRITFNILVGNTDDHARNHAAFWDGTELSLTPAYDICPQPRAGNEASQGMLIVGDDRMSRLSTCLEAAPHFLLSQKVATEIIAQQIKCIGDNWSAVCEIAELNTTDRKLLWGRQFLNTYAFEHLPDECAGLSELRKSYIG